MSLLLSSICLKRSLRSIRSRVIVTRMVNRISSISSFFYRMKYTQSDGEVWLGGACTSLVGSVLAGLLYFFTKNTIGYQPLLMVLALWGWPLLLALLIASMEQVLLPACKTISSLIRPEQTLLQICLDSALIFPCLEKELNDAINSCEFSLARLEDAKRLGDDTAGLKQLHADWLVAYRLAAARKTELQNAVDQTLQDADLLSSTLANIEDHPELTEIINSCSSSYEALAKARRILDGMNAGSFDLDVLLNPSSLNLSIERYSRLRNALTEARQKQLSAIGLEDEQPCDSVA